MLWARFRADLMFATGCYRVLLSKSRVLFVPGGALSMTKRTPHARPLFGLNSVAV
jgi:hypothetical protein